MDPRTALGGAGERAAARWYADRGFRIVARNLRGRLGELDLVARRGDLVAFVEVKTRTGDRFGGGYEAVGPRKRAKLRQLAEAFIASAGRGGSGIERFRFDVASVHVSDPRPPDVHVFEDAF